VSSSPHFHPLSDLQRQLDRHVALHPHPIKDICAREEGISSFSLGSLRQMLLMKVNDNIARSSMLGQLFLISD